MYGPFGSRRRSRRPTINITSLIDVMFLLLIFFMVSSTFRGRSALDITLPQADSAAEQAPANHEIAVNSTGQCFLDQNRVSPTELRRALTDLLAQEPTATLVLRADETAAFQHVVNAIDIARSAGGLHLIIPTRPVEMQTRTPQ